MKAGFFGSEKSEGADNRKENSHTMDFIA
jgi:hypothetical protein